MFSNQEQLPNILVTYREALLKPNSEWPPPVRRSVYCIYKHLFDRELAEIGSNKYLDKRRMGKGIYFKLQRTSYKKSSGQTGHILPTNLLKIRRRFDLLY